MWKRLFFVFKVIAYIAGGLGFLYLFGKMFAFFFGLNPMRAPIMIYVLLGGLFLIITVLVGICLAQLFYWIATGKSLKIKGFL